MKALSQTQTLRWQIASTMAGHGIRVWITQGEEGCFIQRQLPHGGMGLPPSNTGVYGVCTPHQGTRTPTKV